MSCEDYPCCGHELGCCPDFDEDGKQLNMKCTCGAPVPLNSRSSLCQGCLHPPPGHPDYEGPWEDDHNCLVCKIIMDECECVCATCEEWPGDCTCGEMARIPKGWEP